MPRKNSTKARINRGNVPVQVTGLKREIMRSTERRQTRSQART